MIALPLPLISSLVLVFLLLRMWLAERRFGPLAMLLTLCACQGIVISLVQHYGVDSLRPVQPITATLIPPAAWVAFRTTTARSLRRGDLLHLAGPVLAILCLAILPVALGVLIPALFFGYGGLIARRSLGGADALPRMRLEAGEVPGRLWLIMGVALIASGVSDVMIVAAIIGGAAYLQPWIVSFYSSLTLLVVGGLGLSRALAQPADLRQPAEKDEPPKDETESDADLSAADAGTMARLDALMRADAPYLDPDLTLSRLARRLGLPAKHLSGAINRTTGENVSRYINGARIGAAQAALLAGESVTGAMLSSGFNTKSNFNREFLRVSGTSPARWAEARR